MPRCCVPFCVNGDEVNVGEGVAFHAFPNADHLRNVWLAIISGVKVDGKPWQPPKDIDNCRICSVHFQQDKFAKGPSQSLTASAIPTIFPNCSISVNVVSIPGKRPNPGDYDSQARPGKIPYKKVKSLSGSTAAEKTSKTPASPATMGLEGPKKSSGSNGGKTLVLVKQPDGTLVHDGVCNPAAIGKKNLAIVQAKKATSATTVDASAKTADGTEASAVGTGVSSLQPVPNNSKHLVFTDKTGKKFLLLTAPLSSDAARKVSNALAVRCTKEKKKLASDLLQSGASVEAASPKPAIQSEATDKQQGLLDHDYGAGNDSGSDWTGAAAQTLMSSAPGTTPTPATANASSQQKAKKYERPKNAAQAPKARNGTDVSSILAQLCATRPLRRNLGVPINVQIKIEEMRKKLKAKTAQVNRLKATVEKLRVDSESEKRVGIKDFKLAKAVRVLQERAVGGDHAAEFLLDQIRHMNRKMPHFSDCTIQYCAMWAAFSTESYEFIRQTKLMCLPCVTTVKRFLGQTGGDISVSSSLQQRLKTKISKLSEIQKVGTLIIKDMCPKNVESPEAKSSSAADADDDDDDEQEGKETSAAAASKSSGIFLSFAFEGMNLAGSIPIALHYVKHCDGEQLKNLTLPLMEELEKAGFKIIRIVADGTMAALMMFAQLGEGEVKPQVGHPLAADRPLFLACGHVDVMKQVRLQFVDNSQKLSYGNLPISRIFVRRLYDAQKKGEALPTDMPYRKGIFCKDTCNTTKPCYLLRIFSPAITSCLRHKVESGPARGFENADRALEFLEMMYKWCVVQDICSSPPELSDDELSDDDMFYHNAILDWLEVDFTNYLENWRSSCKDPGKNFLNSINYGALSLSTVTAVFYVRYLLHSKFRLTAAVNFDKEDVNAVVEELLQRKREQLPVVALAGDVEHAETTIHYIEDDESANVSHELEFTIEGVDSRQQFNEQRTSTAILENLLKREAAVAVLEALSTSDASSEQYVTVYLNPS